jgi:hypothetical protein
VLSSVARISGSYPEEDEFKVKEISPARFFSMTAKKFPYPGPHLSKLKRLGLSLIHFFSMAIKLLAIHDVLAHFHLN